MSVADDLRAIADRAHAELDALSDYLEHTKTVWLSFKDFVDHGHLITSTTATTGTTVDQAGLLALASGYEQVYLKPFVFRQFVSTFEAFLFDTLHRFFLHNPWQFADKQLRFQTLLETNTREEAISAVVAKHLNELKYEQLREWFVALNKAVKLNCPSDEEIDALAEVKATRDLLEHNAGVVNDFYLRKAGKNARFASGDLVEIQDPYLLDTWQLLKKVAADVSTAAVAKFAKP